MRSVNNCIFMLTFLAVCLFGRNSFGQSLYSYVDEDGVQNFTNVPPVNAVWDLKVVGSRISAPAADQFSFNGKSEAFDPIIEKYALEHRLDPSLIRSIIAAESNFNPRAVSRKGARGLMQLMPATAERLGITNAFDPEENIRGGIQHLRWLMDNFNNDLNLSLAAYNAGENLVTRLGRVPEIKETRDYVRTVTQSYNKSGSEEQTGQGVIYAPAYKFYDATGVLHLTNIPPSR